MKGALEHVKLSGCIASIRVEPRKISFVPTYLSRGEGFLYFLASQTAADKEEEDEYTSDDGKNCFIS